MSAGLVSLGFVRVQASLKAFSLILSRTSRKSFSSITVFLPSLIFAVMPTAAFNFLISSAMRCV